MLRCSAAMRMLLSSPAPDVICRGWGWEWERDVQRLAFGLLPARAFEKSLSSVLLASLHSRETETEGTEGGGKLLQV